MARGEAPGSRDGAEKRPMTFADLQRMKRVSDPQISPSGKWVMFSVTDVDLEKNSKVNHLWVVPLGGGENERREADSSAALRNDNQSALQNDKQSSPQNDQQRGKAERQVTFWKEGESGGRFSPDGRQVLFVSADGGTSTQIYLAAWNDATGALGTPKQLTNVSTEADGAIWSPDSQRILFTSRVYPECSEGSSWVEEDNCNKRKDAEAAANPVKAQVWDHLLYRHWNSYVGPKRSHVLVVSATDGNAVRDLTPRQDIGDTEAPTFSLGGPLGYAWAPDSKEIAFVTNVDLVPAASTNNDVYTLRLDTPGARPLKVSLSLGSDDGPAYSPDGKWLAFRSQARPGYESDRFRLMVLDRETMKTKELVPKLHAPKGRPFDGWIDEFLWAPNSLSFLFTSSIQGEQAVFTYDLCESCEQSHSEALFVRNTDLGEFGDLRAFEDKNNHGFTTLVATKMLVDHPSEIVSINVGLLGHQLMDVLYSRGSEPDIVPNFGTVRALTHMNDAVLHLLDLPEMESFWFSGAANAKVQGFLIRPPNFDETRKYPDGDDEGQRASGGRTHAVRQRARDG